jgi:hypothetical protein
MDEVAGYLPPTANPPTKKPIMLLLKQARAFGLGVVLSTQNPVDVDYKALSNAGTWLVGRLQTEQDKARLVDGLSSAAGNVDVAQVSSMIGNLGKRQFLMRKAGSSTPEIMTTRWAMSYLRGPLDRAQITQVIRSGAASAAPAAGAAPSAAPDSLPPELPLAGAAPAATAMATPSPPMAAASSSSSPSSLAVAGADESPVMPQVAAGVAVSHLDPAAPWIEAVGGVAGGQHLRPAAIARVNLRYDDDAADLVQDEEYEAVLLPIAQIPDGRGFVAVDYDDRDLVPAAPVGVVYGFVPTEAKTKSYWNALQRALVDELARSRTTRIFVNPDLKAYSRPGETQEAFVARCATLVDAAADKEMTALRSKYETKLNAARQKAIDAQINAQALQTEYDSSYGLAATGISVLGSLLGGRRSRSSLAADARRQSTANAKAGAAEQKAAAAGQAVATLEQQLNADVIALDDRWKAKAANVSTRDIPLEKSDITVTDFRLVWIPVS